MEEIKETQPIDKVENQSSFKTTYHKHRGIDAPRISYNDLIDVPVAVATTTKIRAYKSAAQTIQDTQWTKISFNSEDYDTLTEYDNATNYRFTATVAGYYLIHSTVLWNTVVDTKLYKVAIYKNNDEVATDEVLASTNTALSTRVTDTISLAVGDYIEIFVWQNGGGAINTYGGTAYTYLTISKI